VTRELIIDNFAGCGGASIGIEQALGRSPDYAINHDALALAVHAANHPTTTHLPSDVWDVNPTLLVAGRPVGLCWFSPDCKHFSKAKGAALVSKRVRGLAWVAVRWAATVQPRVIVLENVEEFETWGPILRSGRPCPVRQGKTFERFLAALRGLGYRVEKRALRAHHYGAPTIRRRLFLIARRDGRPIVWPTPTHGPGLLPYRTAGECIDLSDVGRSIFDRPRPLAEATMARIARGVVRFVLQADRPYQVGEMVRAFLAKHYGGPAGNPNSGASLRDPMPTITTTGQMGPVTVHLREGEAEYEDC